MQNLYFKAFSECQTSIIKNINFQFDNVKQTLQVIEMSGQSYEGHNCLCFLMLQQKNISKEVQSCHLDSF